MVLKVPVTVTDHIQGNGNALVTLVEYGDYQCPFCGQAYNVVKMLQEHYGEKLRFVFRNFPLSEIHPMAESAAEAAEFAADNNVFWEFHDLLYVNQKSLSIPMLFELAQIQNLPATELEKSLNLKTHEPKIKKDFMGGVRSGVNGTPTFFIDDSRYNGSADFDSLMAAIDSIIARLQ